MNMKNLLAATLLGLFLTGCATVGTPSAPPLVFDKATWENLAKARADERWRLIQEKKFDEAFAFFTEASQKNFSSQALAVGIRNMRFTGGKAEEATCTAEKCEVTVNVSITVRIPRVGNKQQVVPFKEVWIPEKGSLYLIRES